MGVKRYITHTIAALNLGLNLELSAFGILNHAVQAGIQPQQTLTFLRGLEPEIPLLPQDIYNQASQIHRDIYKGYSTTKALANNLEAKGIKYHILKEDSTDQLKDLFWAYPESIKYL
ncbi:hypothetical protein OIDMADRAFT_21678 [Oidiodendron maius Zn]|uniref:Uncharacterized protein n=1 Tax=Oidiodendron maius (strain Zn) TaxID=913774 RepID=A0A0C3C1J1_OIDMZ|nr:hypothetical protein OIDMADRAFT_21678 [Oidiodendron maius Zn]